VADKNPSYNNPIPVSRSLTPNILSIQSHVVYGYAGNSAAVFPLQRLSNVVWAVNTVEFSNHTGYGAWRGNVLASDLVSDLIKGLEERDALVSCSAVLSGYLGSGETGKIIAGAVKKAREYSPYALYCCDPVMGDEGRGFYVKPEIPEIIKNDLLPLADIVCPNQFELNALTGINIKNVNSALEAVNILHKAGPSIVLVTSFDDESAFSIKSGASGEVTQDTISMIASINDSRGEEVYKITTPRLPLGGNVAGTGDMTSAIFLSRYLETKNLKKTLELCASSVYQILDYSYTSSLSGKLKDEPVELKIIEAQEQLVSPSRTFKAERIR